MAYTALYRKYRPITFEQVVGQNHVVTALKNQIKSKRIGHAYLFSGTRGTGKTTIAKIFARAVNCVNPQDGNPCNQCENCLSNLEGRDMDVIEIDAASNNGVDDVRRIIEEIRYVSSEGGYRIYIVDEVHMLSSNAFNALLKTLEEPPSSVIFILATTEPQKVLPTILSRCQRYEFHRIPQPEIAEGLSNLLRQEGVDAEERAVNYIARQADGSMRDGISILDQCVSFYFGQTLTYSHVLQLLGTLDSSVYLSLLHQITDQNVVACLQLLEGMLDKGVDLDRFVQDFVWFLRNVLLLQATPDAASLVDVTEDELAELLSLADELEPAVIMRYIRVLSDAGRQMRETTQKRVTLEMTLVQLCEPRMEVGEEAVLDRVRVLEEKMEKGVVMEVPIPTKQPDTTKTERLAEKEQEKPIIREALPEELQKVADQWDEIVKKMKMPIREYFSYIKPSVKDNELLLIVKDNTIFKALQSKERTQEIKQMIESVIDRTITMEIVYMEEKERNQQIDISKLPVNVPIETEE